MLPEKWGRPAIAGWPELRGRRSLKQPRSVRTGRGYRPLRGPDVILASLEPTPHATGEPEGALQTGYARLDAGAGIAMYPACLIGSRAVASMDNTHAPLSHWLP